MNSASLFGAHERPVINPLFLFRWEQTQQAYVLLYPEGVVKLNDTARAGSTTARLLRKTGRRSTSASGSPMIR